jgi:hypothetical protein
MKYTTPETNPNYQIQISDSTKANVREADPNGGRCLIQNTFMVVHYCHLVERKTMKDNEIVRV